MSVFQSLLSLAAAGTMLISSTIDEIAPQHANGNLLLVNRQWAISSEWVPELRKADVPGSVRMLQPEAADALETMFAACKKETGKTLMSVSGYRSYDRQKTIYNSRLKSTKSKEKTDAYVALPGTSEHQTGLCIDIGQKGKKKNLLGSSFASSAGGKWVRENSWRFGFVLRYDEGWEEMTGYNYECWHIRYVGLEAAAWLHENPMPLEAFLPIWRKKQIEFILNDN